jgi:RNA-splicing ligase RtcB
MELQGKYGKAIVYTEEIEAEAISQIISLLSQPMAQDANVRIMPDCHAGAGCVIGYTAKLTDKIVPNLIGVDIGCGVIAWKLGKRSMVGEKFDKLDEFIRDRIPSGREIHENAIDHTVIEQVFQSLNTGMHFNLFRDGIKSVCKNTHQEYDYVWPSLGSLGGGNHFIEVDKDDHDVLWLVIHSGSRNFGAKIAKFHQEAAKKSINRDFVEKEIERIKKEFTRSQYATEIAKIRKSVPKIPSGLEYLEGEKAKQYFNDMHYAQIYAQLNRRLMGHIILSKFYKIKDADIVESVHNYINFQDQILRKGAISAHAGEKVIIPLNMADGIIIGTGKGNDEWNNSAPHGAGRAMSRSKAKATLSLEHFQETMRRKGVWTSTADKHTLDEAPQAYKKAEHIVKYLGDTVDIEVQMKPVYNYKSSE